MKHPEDLLEERLARLDAGEPLETSLVGLTAAEADLVRLATTLRGLPAPLRPRARVRAERQALLNAAEENPIMTKRRSSPQPAWAFPAALATLGALVVTFVVVAVIIAGAAFVWNQLGPGTAGPAPLAAAPDPNTAALANPRGVVEVQGTDGSWQTAQAAQPVQAGQRVRTGQLSSVALAFYDGSYARLGPNTEVSVDDLDAQTSGPRVVRLTQWLGDTEHHVAPSSDPASTYAVATPSGVGTARGTVFHVLVTVALLARFDVDEGQVDVTSLDVTVVVIAGQSSTIVSGEPPQEPVFRISGEGEVSEIGGTWRIAGRTFLTNSRTVIVGDPQPGDWVTFEGRILSDGTRFADRIVLVRRAIENRFSFVGTVDEIGDATWVISGRAVGLTAETVVAAGIEVGDVVKVEGRLASDGTLQAASISPADEAGLAFSFVGVIESIAEDEWIISGKAVSVGPESEVEEGLAAGEVVAVSGQILEDGTWAADSIARVEAAEAKFEFSGVVESMDPWLVSGVSLETADWTEVDAGLQEGDRVKVEGRILEDGTWLAEEIKLLDPDKPLKFEFVGRVSSLDPWVVAGIDLAVDEETEIEAEIAVGDTVKVEGRILEDGSWLAGEIKLVDASLGCVTTVEIIQLVDGEQVILLDGQTLTLSEASDVEGDIQIASVISITTCTGADGQVIVVSIIVLFQLEELPTPAPSGEGEKVTLCHKVGGKGGGHTLTVSQSAVPAHLAHGDTLGACP